ncbi:hypothetical protein [Robbsia andropogonis]|uniref:hypothetical protein n=1 Tax=Robbsia andropogonis TaxID=28092 RepID=UPI00209FF74B|nr:hypothetical protein [Robbsia andropogonis]MCP1121630.1 hypothetical protein [Robbsia andropogonis]MCP1131449.1 hypothetical protein [Robbsia andropogonis]
MRYAAGVEGTSAVVIHAMSKDSPYNNDPTYLGNTWNAKEKPILKSNNIEIKEMYAEDLKEKLVGGSVNLQDWKDTGGFREDT